MKKRGVGTLLPTDEILRERVDIFAQKYKEYENKEDEKSILIDDFINIIEDCTDDEDESISVSSFEDNQCKEDNYNVSEIVNKTLKVIEKRKKKWNESGLDRYMNSICETNSSDKVGSWLVSNLTYFENENNTFNSSHITFKPPQKCLDQDSVNSVDTAEYILSNKKKKKSTNNMLIRNCCSKNKYLESEKCNIDKNVNSGKGLQSKVARKYADKNTRRKTLTGMTAFQQTENKVTKHSCQQKSYTLSDKSRSDISFSNVLNKKQRKRKKSLRKMSKEQDYFSSSSESKYPNGIEKKKNNQGGKSSIGIIFSNQNSLINSTSLKSQESMVKYQNIFTKKCEKLKNKTETLDYNSKKSVVIYTPLQSKSLPKVSDNKTIKITCDISNKLGSSQSQNHSGDSQNTIEIRANSEVRYIPPDPNTSTSSSGSDVINTLCKTKDGVFLEYETLI